MKWFNNSGIFAKLMMAFGLVGLFIAGLGAFAVWQLGALNAGIVDMNANRIPALRDLLSQRANLLESRLYQYQLFIALEDPDQANGKRIIEETLTQLGEAHAQALAAEAHYALQPRSADELKLADAVTGYTKPYWAASGRLAALVAAGDLQGTRNALSGSIQGTRKKANAALVRDIDYNIQAAADLAAATAATYERARALVVGGAVLATCAGLGLGALLARRLKRSLAHSVTVANKMAAGELDVELEPVCLDETGQLQSAMAGMIDVFRLFATEQARLLEAHRAGMIDATIEARSFPGEYKTMAAATNQLAAIHIGVQNRVLEVMAHYAQGDFSVDLEQLPGEQARITTAVQTMKRNLTAISADIDKLVQAAAAGDFSAQGDATAYGFEFAGMVAGLNRLMDTSSHALADLGQLLAAVARGDLNQSIEAEYQGMLGQIRDDANRTVRQLKQVIGEISSASESIHVAASEIAAGNLDLSSRTEEQAASLEETAASMEQQTATVRETAANVREADHLAQGVATIASRAASEVTTVVANMSEIAASSERIAGISSLIDGIAFQTNILALNAAVEAARAGVEGRGFAVVAAEIRTLAQRSGEAAKQIKSLIEEETAHVQSGCASATGAEQAMVEVAQAIGRVTELLAEMNLAAGQQAEGIDQVNTAISQMDQVTQQNAALVEEAAAASQSLREQADGLKASIAVFAADACTIVAAAPTVLLGSGQRPKGAPSPRLAARPPKRLSA